MAPTGPAPTAATAGAGRLVPLPDPVPRAAEPSAGSADRAVGALAVRVVDVGLACCALEVVAASTAARGAAAPAGGPRLHVLVVAGTVTDVLAPHVRRAYEELPEPRRVVSFGSCSNSGGPYWDSYAVTKGVGQLIPVDVWVPGCPPRPEALADALRELR